MCARDLASARDMISTSDFESIYDLIHKPPKSKP